MAKCMALINFWQKRVSGINKELRQYQLLVNSSLFACSFVCERASLYSPLETVETFRVRESKGQWSQALLKQKKELFSFISPFSYTFSLPSILWVQYMYSIRIWVWFTVQQKKQRDGSIALCINSKPFYCKGTIRVCRSFHHCLPQPHQYPRSSH